MSKLMFKNTKNILSFFISGIVIMVFVMPMFVLAFTEVDTGDSNTQVDTGTISTGPINIINPFKANTIKELIETIVNDILMPIGGVVAVMMIMYAGFLYVTARGSSEQIKKAHDALKWAVIGAAILLGAWVISQAIGTTIDQLKSP